MTDLPLPIESHQTDVMMRRLIRDKQFKWWFGLTVAVMGCSIAMILFFEHRNPLCIDWDENEYLDDAYRDLIHYRTDGVRGLWHSWINTGAYRPPAHRLVLLPLTLTHSINLPHLRIEGVLLFIASNWMLYLAISKVTTRSAALLGVTIFACSLAVVTSCRSYGTEQVHYLAVAASMFFLFQAVLSPRKIRAWTGLGIAMGIGLLSKLSFPWVIGPMYAYCLLISIITKQYAQLAGLLCSAILAAGIAGPWYWTDFQNYLYLARISQHWDRMSVGKLTMRVAWNWVDGVWSEGFGGPLSWLIVSVSVATVLERSYQFSSRKGFPRNESRQLRWDWSNARTVLLPMCLSGALPFPMAQLFFSQNHAVRLVTPSFLPALVALAVMVGMTSLLNSRLIFCAIAALLAWQVQSLIIPRNQYLYDLWDMEPLYSLAHDRGLAAPHIGLIGYHWNFDREALAEPFLERGTFNEVFRVWDYTQPWDLKTIKWYAQSQDMLVVPPDYKGIEMAQGKGDLDNNHNKGFDQIIRSSSLFTGPTSFLVGRKSNPVKINVYFNLKSLAGASPATSAAGMSE